MEQELVVLDAPAKEAPRAAKGSARGRGKRGGAGEASRGRPRGELNAELGRRGEDAAARFLYRHGYEILERNWTCIAGEADIIACDGDTVVFVEVKTRSSCDRGLPSEAVNAAKRTRYERIAACYMANYPVLDVDLRFDVVALVVIAPDRAMVRHHIGAFSVD